MDRRRFIKLCATASALVAARPATLAATPGPLQPARPSRLVHRDGASIAPGDLEVGRSYVFHYPYLATPCFLIDLGEQVDPTEGLITEDGQQYRWQGGSGPRRSVVAFSAICAHKMSYPTPSASFINYRHAPFSYIDDARQRNHRERVIYCCSEGSAYDPAAGGRVLGGPARQPLAAVALAYDEQDGAFVATGTYGGDMFERFFDEFGFQLALQHRTDDIRRPVDGSTEVLPLEDYSASSRQC